MRYTLSAGGDNAVRAVPLFQDHERINPRSIGGSLNKLVEEFHKRRPQLHVGLAWVEGDGGKSKVKVFDGQHKATAQVWVGGRCAG